MVNIQCVCEEYGKEFHVTFNDKKTTGMVTACKLLLDSVMLNNNVSYLSES